MPRRKKPSFTPATEFKVTRLKRNGPKEGQSYDSWAKGKERSDNEWNGQREKNFNRLIY